MTIRKKVWVLEKNGKLEVDLEGSPVTWLNRKRGKNYSASTLLALEDWRVLPATLIVEVPKAKNAVKPKRAALLSENTAKRRTE